MPFFMKIHEIKTRVRYQETDQMGIVYYANFLVYFEMGRTEFLRNLGLPYSELEREHIYFPVTEAHCRFRAPAHYDDILIIQTFVSELKHATVEFKHKIIREGDNKLIAEGFTKLACLNASRKPTAIPEKLKKLLQ
ncbi:MAG: 4-hydroxybenzoyl-CoA thioesterase family active site [Candidatus Jettenia ecosi]|uniref:4-hydroxybenzoyl-CoA thioesterase family active site n=1 Tax=Candidatus Jettenia ecosi TaxID=2494326 RepID=A0A533QRJ2_9BACT|nr:MAG: 4-hydroxybenzoyl-CoA thioesterase family active site [Candidatus Jettenia ecosi]